MNRRHFIRGFAGALMGFSVLPPATTYERIWKAVITPKGRWVPNPEWENAEWDILWCSAFDEGLSVLRCPNLWAGTWPEGMGNTTRKIC